MPLILMFGIMGGLFTPTEASIVTVTYSLIVGLFVYRELNLKLIFKTVSANMRSAASILILIGLANVFASILITEHVPQTIANSILSFSTNKIVVILIINLILLFTGMFMESIAAILITFPVLLPVAASIGMDRVHFGVMAVLNLMIGLVTPPVGICLTTAAQIGHVSMVKSVKANMPFLIAMLIVLLLVSFVPPVTMFIPNLLMGG
jgi:tripartite ATP-independent transporter DctM subunit